MAKKAPNNVRNSAVIAALAASPKNPKPYGNKGLSRANQRAGTAARQAAQNQHQRMGQAAPNPVTANPKVAPETYEKIRYRGRP